jgi:fluoride exporter
MPTAIAVAIAGSLGAVTRYALDYFGGEHLLPHHQVYVTFAINIVGSFLLGVLIGVHPSDKTRLVLGVGFLGAFTTFSTIMAQVYHAAGDESYTTALLLPTASVIVGATALYLGVSIATMSN